MILNFRKRLRTYYTTIWRHLVRVCTRTPRLIARFAYAGASIAVAKHSKLMDRRGIRKRPRVDSGGSGSSDGAAPAPPSATMSRRASSDDGGLGKSGEASMEDIYSMMQLFGDQVRPRESAPPRAPARARTRARA